MEEPTVSLKTYYQVTVALMLLLVLTVAVYFLSLGPFGIVVALGIAFSKAALIVLIFMHVRYSSRLTQVMAAAGIFWLSIMLILTLSEYISRGWIGASGV